MKLDEYLVKTLTRYSQTTKRSQQKEVGVSQIGGCRRQVWHHLQGTPKENDTLKLASLMGTAIHSMIENVFADAVEEEWHNYLLEAELIYEDIKGHVDLFIPDIGAVVDWKTTKLRNLAYFPSQQQRWQVQLYGWLLEKNGYNVNTVTLVAIARDGDERDIKTHTEEYNSAIAEEAIAWFRDVQSRTEPPAPEKYAVQFCQHYCPFYGQACGGKGKEIPQDPIQDNATISAVKRYMELSTEIKSLEAERDGVKAALENVSGVTPDGVKVAWSQVSGRKVLDEEYVAQFFEKHGEELPYKQGNPSMRLVVK